MTLAGCAPPSPSASGARRATGGGGSSATSAGGAGGAATTDGGAGGAATPDGGAGGATPTGEGGFAITVYYTVVESLHGGPAVDVVGCPDITCSGDEVPLGTWSADFVDKVAEEGTGRVTSGPHAGRFLDWSADTGYWLDDAPRDANGGALEPFVSAAADPSIAFGRAFSVLDCGVDDQNGEPADPAACAAIRAASWVVRDRFTEGAVGAHVDLYVGEEDVPDFESTPRFLSNRDAVLLFR